jgi:hypothetical protein
MANLQTLRSPFNHQLADTKVIHPRTTLRQTNIYLGGCRVTMPGMILDSSTQPRLRIRERPKETRNIRDNTWTKVVAMEVLGKEAITLRMGVMKMTETQDIRTPLQIQWHARRRAVPLLRPLPGLTSINTQGRQLPSQHTTHNNTASHTRSRNQSSLITNRRTTAQAILTQPRLPDTNLITPRRTSPLHLPA